MKKIKLLLLTACVAAVTVSCVSQDEPTTSSDKKIETNYETIKPTSIQIVPTQEGMVTMVYDGDEFIGAYDVPTPIEVPMVQYSIGRGESSSIRFSYVPTTEGSKFLSGQKGPAYKVIMFEDSPLGDNDYNDVIIHTYQYIDNNKPVLMIQPIAMGNTQVLKLGADFYLVDANKNVTGPSEVYFSKDLKKEYFQVNDYKAFVNTMKKNRSDLTGYKPKTVTSLIPTDFLPKVKGDVNLSGYTLIINFFIESNNGTRMYAVPSDLTPAKSWLQDNGYPYGFVMTDIRNYYFKDGKNVDCGKDWINYPAEIQNINTVYPGFDDWVAGKSSTHPDWDNPTAGTFVNAIDATTKKKNGTDVVTNSMYDYNNTSYK